MNFICWFKGHKENMFITDCDMTFFGTGNMMIKNKKIGTVNLLYKLQYCDRCDHLYLKKESKTCLNNNELIK